jgi:DNA-binding IclR family transcriptional regulator
MNFKEINLTNVIPGTKSFSRNIDILQLIADAPVPPKLAELLEKSGLTRPTLYRVLAVLEAEELIVQNPDKSYVPGIRLITLARIALAGNDIIQIARPELERLGELTAETVHLGVRSKDEMVIADKIESRDTVRMASMVGMRFPIHTTGLGKAYLIGLPVEQAEEFIEGRSLEKVTQYTTTNPELFKQKLSDGRAQGYIIDDQENEEGIVCYGSPIFDATGKTLASVSVTTPSFRLKDDRNHYIKPLLKCAVEISTKLGFRGN